MTNHATLTEIEILGLNSKHNFADGHAYHELHNSQQDIIERLSQLWGASAATTVKEAEWRYQRAFWQLAEAPSLNDYPYFRICPTASSDLDIVAAWLAENKLSVTLLEPTFDNLYLLLKRRGISIASLGETLLHTDEIESALSAINTDTLFLVNPNNPTGRVLTVQQFQTIIDCCVKSKKTLLLDNTFRFFTAPEFDYYQLLIDSGVTFISIEDTGKVWPTQDMKASLVFYSKDIAKELVLIYEEIYLCVSNFSLAILTEFLIKTKKYGLQEIVWSEVKSRRSLFRQAITDTALHIDPVAMDSQLSVEWIKINAVFSNDYAAMEYFKSKNLILLPGRNFYWSDPLKIASSKNLRIALLKPRNNFLQSIHALRTSLLELHWNFPLCYAKKRE